MTAEFQELKQRAWEANLEIPRRGLAIYTFGNVSAFDPVRGVVAIKPSGVEYERLGLDDMVVVDLDGRVVEGGLRPSSDTRTHLVLYRAFRDLGITGIVHTHSTYATGWAQARAAIPVFGTTHADHLAGPVPVTEIMGEAAVAGDYEHATGEQILDCFRGLDPLHTPMVLVAGHGPFTWGATPAQAVYHAVVLEELARMAFITRGIRGDAAPLPDYLIRKHFERKHGSAAYYGQDPR
jgi:L-ribulose-5-phosphate 4-epimerase